MTGVALAAAAAALLLFLLWGFQRRLIYLPITGAVPPASAFFPEVEELSFETEDGVRLGGWFVPAQNESEGAAILVFNGNAGDRSFRAPLASVLSRAGLSVMLFDYRGYGGNPGSPSEAGLIADARAAYVRMSDQFPDDPVTQRTAARLALAERRPVAAVEILRSLVGKHEDYETQRLLALAKFRSVKLAAAQQAVGRSLELEPRNAAALRLQAQIHLWGGDSTAVIRTLRRLRAVRARAVNRPRLRRDGRGEPSGV